MTSGPEQPIVIVGAGETAAIAYEYFTYDSPYRVAAFSAEEAHLPNESPGGLPLVPLDRLVTEFPPSEYGCFVAVSSTHLNRLRARLFRQVKALGFSCVSYVSSRSFVWRNVTLGENVFLFEHNVLQHNVSIGDNVVLWSGNHVGHQTRIRDHCFVSSHCVISGFCEIEESCFLGVNSTFADGIKVGHDAVVGAGAVVIGDLAPRGVYVGNPARPTGRDSFDTFAVPQE